MKYNSVLTNLTNILFLALCKGLTCKHMLSCRSAPGGSARPWDSILAMSGRSSNLLSLHYWSHLLLCAWIPRRDNGWHVHERVWQPPLLLRLFLPQDSWKIPRWERTEGVSKEDDRTGWPGGHHVIMFLRKHGQYMCVQLVASHVLVISALNFLPCLLNSFKQGIIFHLQASFKGYDFHLQQF